MDNELKLLAVTPTFVESGVQAVTMVTPVAKLPSARRKSLESKSVFEVVMFNLQKQ